MLFMLSPPDSVGNCACPAHAADEGWYYKTAITSSQMCQVLSSFLIIDKIV